MMKIATGVQCLTCKRELRAFVQTSGISKNESGCLQSGYCSISCYEAYIESNKNSNFKDLFACLVEKEGGLQVWLEECSSKPQAEFIFFLQLLRSISECDIMKLVLSRDNLLQRFNSLQSLMNKRTLCDFLFSTDIMKLSLNIQMTPERVNHVISQLWEIAVEARERIKSPDEDLSINDQIDSVDREIFHAIAKTTIDNILNLGTETNLKSTEQKMDIFSLRTEILSSSSRDIMMTENAFKDRSEQKGLFFVDLEDDFLKSFSLILRDNCSVHRRFNILEEESEPSQVTFQNIAEVLCREEMKSNTNFVFLKKHTDIDPINGIITRYKLVDFSDTIIKYVDKEVFIAHGTRPDQVYDKKCHFLLLFNFPAEYFLKPLEFCYFVNSPLEIPIVLQFIEKNLTQEYLPLDSTASLRLNLQSIISRTNALKEFFASRMTDHKIISIEILPTDIVFEAEDEESIYSKEEIEYFKACEQDVRSEKFLMNLAKSASVELPDLMRLFRQVLCDDTLLKYADQKADRLRAYRCLRVARVLALGKHGFTIHHLSFIVASLIKDFENKSEECLMNSLLAPSRVLEYEVQPDPGKCLLKILNSDILPKIVCIKHNLGSPDQTLLSMFLKQEICLNSNSKYKLKSVLQTEYDVRGVCSCISFKGDSITNFSNFGPLSVKILNTKSSKSLNLLFELQTQWILLENSSTSS